MKRERVQNGARVPLETLLREALPGYRWFGAKSRVIRRVTVLDCIPLPEAGRSVALHLCRVAYARGRPDLYLVPLDHSTLTKSEPLGRDPADDPRFATALLKRVFAGGTGRTAQGRWLSSCAYLGKGAVIPAPHRLKGEQSNTSIRFGQKYMLKLMRRLEPGVSPEVEIGRHLAARRFSHSPMFLGELEYVPEGGKAITLCTVHRFMPARGDAWTTFVNELARWRTLAVSSRLPPVPGGWLEASLKPIPRQVRKMMGPFIGWAERLGRRTGELHTALAARNDNPEFEAERMTQQDYDRRVRELLDQGAASLRMVRAVRARLPAGLRESIDRLTGLGAAIRARLADRGCPPLSALMIRTHGDYHLGQVLYTGRDFLIIDFEGEPARSLEERRRKQSPLRDVAGMLRSFHYAACVGLGAGPRADAWYGWICAAFMLGYREAAWSAGLLENEGDLRRLLDVHLLEKALYELRYELNNRPDWVHVPLTGILSLLEDKP